MDRRYFEAAVNQPHKFLGRWLHPFCFYDILFLEIDENPLWLGHRAPLWGDLITARLITSSKAGSLLNVSSSNPAWRRLWARLQVIFLRRKFDFDIELKKFMAYVEDHYSKPRLWTADDAKESKAPWLLAVAALIESETSRTHEEIWTAPAGEMLWLHATLAERDGQDIMSPEEEEAISVLAASP